MKRTQVQFTDDQGQRLRKVATQRGISVAALVREAVDRFMSSAEHGASEAQRRRALAAVGRFASGRSDISVRHDDYLAEIDDSHS